MLTIHNPQPFSDPMINEGGSSSKTSIGLQDWTRLITGKK